MSVGIGIYFEYSNIKSYLKENKYSVFEYIMKAGIEFNDEEFEEILEGDIYDAIQIYLDCFGLSCEFCFAVETGIIYIPVEKSKYIDSSLRTIYNDALVKIQNAKLTNNNEEQINSINDISIVYIECE